MGANLIDAGGLLIKSAATSRGGPGPFQGPSSYPQLRWWSLIYAHRLDYLRCFCSANMVSGVSVQVSGKVGAITYSEH
jgi:hypothetical protein